ncbi:MAG: tellurium resistance protein, partial [Alphaproteobacteria bacterium]|nr:tellurium resistance protein [Alphaproteobacteria bacterium]
MTDPVFLFGTLRHAPVRTAVLGSPASVRDAQLSDHTVLDVGGYPVLTDRRGACAEGQLLWPDAAQLARLDQYEGLFGYSRQRVTTSDDQVV